MDKNRDSYTISETANEIGIHPKTLRRWEKKQYFKAGRTNGKQRRYSEKDIEILKKLKTNKPNQSNEISIPERKFSKIPTPESKSSIYTYIALFTTLVIAISYIVFKNPKEPTSPTVKLAQTEKQPNVQLPRVANFLDGKITIGADTGELSFLDEKGNIYAKNSALIQGGVHTSLIQFLPSEVPENPQIGSSYVKKKTGDLMYYDGSDWITISKSSSNNSLQSFYDNKKISLIANAQDIDFTLGSNIATDSASATASATSLSFTLAGPSSTFSILGGANQEILKIDDDAVYPVKISQPTQITGNFYAPQFIDTASDSYFLDPANTEISLSVAGNATISATLKFSNNNEYITSDTDNYLTLSSGLGIGGTTTYGFNENGNISGNTGNFSSTLTANAKLDVNGQVELGDGDDTIDISGTDVTITANSTDNHLQLISDNQIIFKPSGDTDDYMYTSSSANATGLFFSGYTTKNPGIRINPSNNKIEYRDENEESWSALDTLSVGPWEQGESNEVYLTNSSNYVGIGMSDPSVALDVEGSIEYTGTITDVSDIRLKENFAFLQNSLEKIKTLSGFTFNNIGSKLKEIGLSAQDVQKVFPDAVSIMDKKGHLGLSYTQLIAPIVEAIKELDKKIEDLKKAPLSPTSENNIAVQILDSHIISPVSDIYLINQLNIKNKENQTIVSIDNQGNTIFSGKLKAKTIESEKITTNELIASKIQTPAIEKLKNTVTNLVNQYKSNTATASSEPISEIEKLVTNEIDKLKNSTTATTSSDIDIASINADFGFFSEYLAIMGQTTTTDLKVNNLARINSISSLDNILNLQAGLMILNNDGHVQINGDLTISGSLIASNIISPPDKSLDIHIASQSAFTIYNQISNNPVASINASGSAQLNSLKLNAAGTATISAGLNHKIIKTNKISKKSQVIITFGSSYAPATKYWVIKESDKNQFTIFVNYPVKNNTQIDWLIIN